MSTLTTRIEKLEQRSAPSASNVDEMTDEELLAIVPQAVQDLMDKLTPEDLHEFGEALRHDRAAYLAPEGLAIVEQIVKEYENTRNTD